MSLPMNVCQGLNKLGLLLKEHNRVLIHISCLWEAKEHLWKEVQ